MGNSCSLPRDTIPSQIGNLSESGGMAEYGDFKRPIQILKLDIYCSCHGCQEKVKRVLRDIDGVHTVTIDAAKQTATVTGTVNSAEVLVKKLWKDCRKHAELCPVTQKNEGKTQSQHREQNSSKDVVGGKKEHTAMAEREMQRNEARTQNQHTQQNSGKDVGGDKKEHTALARRERSRKKPTDPKQQTQQKPGNDGGGNANDNAAVAQSNMQNKTLKTQKQQNSGQHEGL